MICARTSARPGVACAQACGEWRAKTCYDTWKTWRSQMRPMTFQCGSTETRRSTVTTPCSTSGRLESTTASCRWEPGTDTWPNMGRWREAWRLTKAASCGEGWGCRRRSAAASAAVSRCDTTTEPTPGAAGAAKTATSAASQPTTRAVAVRTATVPSAASASVCRSCTRRGRTPPLSPSRSSRFLVS